MPRKRTLSQAEEDSLNCALREPGISQSKAFKVWSIATGLSGLSRGVLGCAVLLLSDCFG